MKYVFLIFVFFVTNAVAQDENNWSLGIGSNYGGIGGKYSQPISTYLDIYANLGQSAGFALLSDKDGVAACAGAEIPFTPNQHHTINLGFAFLDAKDFHSDYDGRTEKNKMTGHAISYTYYFSGLRARGQAIGVGRVHLTDDDEILNSLSISWGYKF